MKAADLVRSGARRFEEFWLAPESAANINAARILLAATALWVVLSRFDLPSTLLFPSELWQTVPWERRLRFLLIFSAPVERVLWGALHIALLMALIGWKRRWSCIASGLLLYHFAPLETIIWTSNPYLRGLTIPCLGLLLLGFAEPRWTGLGRGAASGWALRLTQALFCAIYFFAGYAKLFWSGVEWAKARNMRLYLLGLDEFLGFHTSLARWLAESPFFCSAIGITGLVFEILFPVVLFSRRSRLFFIPAAVVFHVGNSVLFHVFFHNIALLLMFVNWRPVFDSCRAMLISLPSVNRPAPLEHEGN